MKITPKKKRIFIGAAAVAAVLILVEQMFIGWRYSYGPFKALGEKRTLQLAGNAEEYALDTVEPMADSPLAGKTVLFLGSSVTYGAYSLGEALPEYFSARMGCTAIKEAVSGTTLAGTDDDTYVNRLKQNVSTSEPADLVICQLSTNDATLKKELGEIAVGENADDFYPETVTGALESIIAYCDETWGCPVVFFTGSYYESEHYDAMVARLYELQGKWNIGILDLWTNGEFNAITDEQRSLYMYDNIHPTRAGYRDWWGPELEKQLCAFLNQ